ncbi:MAG: aspartyl-phosphate phosphatase Spo0E family protein [Clostridia bacterium]|nr:aspartyl-phosphate phosphatase Spo0E family protein [Clostridia bacterium]
MLNDIICKKREELNQSIITGQDYKITYKLSIELDELISEFYKKKNVKETKEKRKVLYIV